MTIKQVVKLAQAGELSNIAVKSNVDAIVGYINLGLIELYKRFPISVKEYVVELLDNVDVYTMPSDYMWLVNAYGEVPADDLTNVVNLLAINEEDNPLSINTPSWNTVQIPLSVAGGYVSLIYVAAPGIIEYTAPVAPATEGTYTVNGVSATEIAIPVQMIEALLHYIGYRAHAAMDGNIQAENSTHYTRFEKSCERIKELGMMTSDDLSMYDRYSINGWV